MTSSWCSLVNSSPENILTSITNGIRNSANYLQAFAGRIKANDVSQSKQIFTFICNHGSIKFAADAPFVSELCHELASGHCKVNQISTKSLSTHGRNLNKYVTTPSPTVHDNIVLSFYVITSWWSTWHFYSHVWKCGNLTTKHIVKCISWKFYN